MTGRWQQARAAIAERWRWFWGIREPGADTATGARGRMGEDAAAEYLRGKGWKIVARNWRHRRDELDVVAWDGEVLAFVEVRTRAAQASVQGYHSVTERKKRALARAVRAYLRGLAQKPAHFRFDIVEVKVSDGTAPEVVLHAGVPLLSHNSQPASGGARRN
jgi:putative endonuclease